MPMRRKAAWVASKPSRVITLGSPWRLKALRKKALAAVTSRVRRFCLVYQQSGRGAGSVATLQACRDRLVGCSFWTLRFAACSSGASLNRRSFSWRSAGICASRFRTATSRTFGRAWALGGSRYRLEMGPAVCSGTGAALAPAPQADERLVAGGRDVRADERQMGVLVPGGGLQRCDDRLPALGQT